jgi:hypothetical protein
MAGSCNSLYELKMKSEAQDSINGEEQAPAIKDVQLSRK